MFRYGPANRILSALRYTKSYKKPPVVVFSVSPLKQMFLLTWFHSLNFSLMKKTLHSFHLGENAKTALFAFGFLSLVMLLSYLYWFA